MLLEKSKSINRLISAFCFVLSDVSSGKQSFRLLGLTRRPKAWASVRGGSILRREDFDGDGGWVEGVTANVVALCGMQQQTATTAASYNVKRIISPSIEENVCMRDDIQAAAGGAVNQNSRAPVAKERA